MPLPRAVFTIALLTLAATAGCGVRPSHDAIGKSCSDDGRIAVVDRDLTLVCTNQSTGFALWPQLRWVRR